MKPRGSLTPGIRLLCSLRTSLAFVLCWVISFSNFVVLMHNKVYNTAYYNPLKHGTTCLAFAILPLILSADVAHVSSMCDTLLGTINDLRMEWDSTKEAQVVHARTFPLQTTLANLNQGQGLGVRHCFSNACRWMNTPR